MFRFSLSTLLRIRTLREEQALARLQRAQGEVASAEREVERLRRGRECSQQESDSRCFGAEIHFVRKIMKLLESAEQGARADLALRREKREACRMESETMRREREILERLSERERRAYEVEERRREQRRLDAVHALIRGSRNGQPLPTDPADRAECGGGGRS